MKKLLTVVLVSWLFTCTLAQDSKTKQDAQKPDFSGTWTRNNPRTDAMPAQDPMAMLQMTLKITYQSPKLKINRTVSNDRSIPNILPPGVTELKAEFSYFTDGRGESNRSTFGPSPFGASDVKSKTGWEGDKLVVRSSASRPSPDGGSVIVTSTETWELSSDGKTLIETTTFNSLVGTRTFQKEFTRVRKP